jgi:hypothetical protein
VPLVVSHTDRGGNIESCQLGADAEKNVVIMSNTGDSPDAKAVNDALREVQRRRKRAT